MKVLSQRVTKINESPLTKWDSMVKSKGKGIIHLNVGQQPDFNVLSVIAEAVKKTIKTKGNNHYTSINGTQEIREAISLFQKRVFNMEYNTREIILTNGAKEGLFISLGALVNSEDEVIIVAPYWSTYLDVIVFFGGNPVVVNANENFHLNVDEIKKVISAKTKAVIINSPNNPSGAVYTIDELEQLATIVADNDLYVISDEIYGTIIYDSEFCSIASVKGMKERTIVINGFSKSFSMTGYRLGYTLSSLEIANAMLKIKSNSTGNTNSFFQKVLIEAICNNFDELIISCNQMRTELKRRKEFLCGSLEELEIEYIIPEGAFYVFAKIPSEFNVKSKEFAEHLLVDAKVAVAPGIFFGEKFDDYIRISFSSSVEDIKRALEKIKNCINKKRVI